MTIGPEWILGILVAVITLTGTIFGAVSKFRSEANAETTKRIDLLLKHYGNEIEKLRSQMDALQEEIGQEKQLTDTLQEESTKWRELLELALNYLRTLLVWTEQDRPPPPPTLPEELGPWIWEEIQNPG